MECNYTTSEYQRGKQHLSHDWKIKARTSLKRGNLISIDASSPSNRAIFKLRDKKTRTFPCKM